MSTIVTLLFAFPTELQHPSIGCVDEVVQPLNSLKASVYSDRFTSVCLHFSPDASVGISSIWRGSVAFRYRTVVKATRPEVHSGVERNRSQGTAPKIVMERSGKQKTADAPSCNLSLPSDWPCLGGRGRRESGGRWHTEYRPRTFFSRMFVVDGNSVRGRATMVGVSARELPRWPAVDQPLDRGGESFERTEAYRARHNRSPAQDVCDARTQYRIEWDLPLGSRMVCLTDRCQALKAVIARSSERVRPSSLWEVIILGQR